MRKFLSMLLGLVIITGSSARVIAAEYSARSITVFKTEGSVEMTKGTVKKFTAKEGMKLADGYTISTGVASHAWLRLDEDTLIKMDSRSKVSVSKASARKLSVTTLSGSILVDADTQKDGDVLEIRAGNSALAVRGTSFAVECMVNGANKFLMFSGSASVDDTPLETGMVLTVTEDKPESKRIYALTKLTVDSNLSPFVLDTVKEKMDELLENNIITKEIADTIDEMREESEKKQQQQENEFTGTVVDESGVVLAPPTPKAQSTSSIDNNCVAVAYQPNPLGNPPANVPANTSSSFSDLASAVAYVNSLPSGVNVQINVYRDCQVYGSTSLTIGKTNTLDVVNFDINANLYFEGSLNVIGNCGLNILPSGVLSGKAGSTISFDNYSVAPLRFINSSPNVTFVGVPSQPIPAIPPTYTFEYNLINGIHTWQLTPTTP